jgi:hypothetical protein
MIGFAIWTQQQLHYVCFQNKGKHSRRFRMPDTILNNKHSVMQLAFLGVIVKLFPFVGSYKSVGHYGHSVRIRYCSTIIEVHNLLASVQLDYSSIAQDI